MNYNSWELTDFNLEGHINLPAELSEKFGILKVMRTEDGVLTLSMNSEYGKIDQEKPTPANFIDVQSILGFTLDIGIERKKRLTYENGMYLGGESTYPQSKRVISQANFDATIFESVASLIQSRFQSGDITQIRTAIRNQLLVNQYNNARLLYPNFYEESYLSLMRIIDATAPAQGAYSYALSVAMFSSTSNTDVFSKISAIEGYVDRISVALELFANLLEVARTKKFECYAEMLSLDEAGQFMFSCFYSAYQYRNEFVHHGVPFPSSVKDTIDIQADSGLAYLSFSLGSFWVTMNRHDGLKDGDLIDVHEIVSDPLEAEAFQKSYFLLLPTWYFLKRMAREMLMKKLLS